MAERVRVREIDDDEGSRLLRIVRRGSGSVVTWRWAQMVLWPAQGMTVQKVAELAFTSEDRVRDVIHNFNADGFGSLYPKLVRLRLISSHRYPWVLLSSMHAQAQAYRCGPLAP
ncbi:transposase family protein [Streptosporangium pseudovulgare]|uniref:transposase family protein n=1 Tax=Streptosporangium pseudovulgare TaxID=35765 RepID=UPI001E5F7E7D|nr:transposase family protein [Streptosporangium pseudovulgare]